MHPFSPSPSHSFPCVIAPYASLSNCATCFLSIICIIGNALWRSSTEALRSLPIPPPASSSVHLASTATYYPLA
ncbi:hypothetical protein SAY86_021809 [Trapa natans]|uniref:Uncharacterized protein n=1 Tax=Trapa natans TaxID=22666 RepID=A0AAN7ML11_TRANT|nr:hypothetical protein SAY86_021809 [Trapa natans]